MDLKTASTIQQIKTEIGDKVERGDDGKIKRLSGSLETTRRLLAETVELATGEMDNALDRYEARQSLEGPDAKALVNERNAISELLVDLGAYARWMADRYRGIDDVVESDANGDSKSRFKTKAERDSFVARMDSLANLSRGAREALLDLVRIETGTAPRHNTRMRAAFIGAERPLAHTPGIALRSQ
ncbi:MAG: hypothetical protein AAF654_01865 [Myxococcota bacterium]